MTQHEKAIVAIVAGFLVGLLVAAVLERRYVSQGVSVAQKYVRFMAPE